MLKITAEELKWAFEQFERLNVPIGDYADNVGEGFSLTCPLASLSEGYLSWGYSWDQRLAHVPVVLVTRLLLPGAANRTESQKRYGWRIVQMDAQLCTAKASDHRCPPHSGGEGEPL